MDLRKSYFSKRNEFHKENQINRVRVLAKRELDTFDIIKRLSSLQKFFSWNNSAVLDLGAGDQFLRNAVEQEGRTILLLTMEMLILVETNYHLKRTVLI